MDDNKLYIALRNINMYVQDNKMGLRILVLVSLLMSICFVSAVQAIPESDAESFRASARYFVEFDDYYNGTIGRTLTLKSFHSEASYYYVVFRANVGDAKPYDEFDVSFRCEGDTLATSFKTTDYPSWEESGQISFKREFNIRGNETYFNNTINVSTTFCTVLTAGNLVVDSNDGYTKFMMELVPILRNIVITPKSSCELTSAHQTLDSELDSLYKVFVNNINIFYTLFIVAQILAIIFVVIGIPILVFLMIRWTIWKTTGRRILAPRE